MSKVMFTLASCQFRGSIKSVIRGAYNLTDSEPLKNQPADNSDIPNPVTDKFEVVKNADARIIVKTKKTAAKINIKLFPTHFLPSISLESQFHI